MSALLDGFNAGMRLGQPLVEAKLQKKAAERQAVERKKDRQLTRDEGEATRALAKTLKRRELKQRAKLSAAGITSAEKIAGDANTTRKDIAEQASTERQTIATLASGERGDAAKATAAFRQKSLENQAEGLAQQKARDEETFKTDMERMQDKMLENETKKDELEQASKVVWLPPDERRAIQTELRVLNTADAMMAKAMDMAIANPDPTAMARVASMYVDRQPTGAYQFIEAQMTPLGKPIEGSSDQVFNQRTGALSPANASQGATGSTPTTKQSSMDGTPQVDKSVLRLNTDGTLSVPTGSNQAARDHALRGFGSPGTAVPQQPTAGHPNLDKAGSSGGGGGGLGPPTAPSVPPINLNIGNPLSGQNSLL